jgi:hypothetical protein
MLFGGCDKQYSGTGALERKSTIKVHDPILGCFLAGERGLRYFFVLSWCPLCNELCQGSALDC